MSLYINIEEIKEKYKNGDYNCKIKIPQKLNNDYIFDENLSVKKNREKIERYNREIDNIRVKYHAEVCRLNKKFQDDIITYISNAYNMSEKQARIIETYVYTEKHTYMSEYFIAIDEVSEMVSQIIES